MLAFVAVGLLILHRTLFVSPEQQQQMLEESTYTRMLVVRDILYNEASGMAMVVFALIGSDGTDSFYFSYDCAPGTFQLGDRRGMDIRRLTASDNRRIIAQFNTLNISEISLGEFKELPEAAKKMFDMIDRVTTAR